MTNRTPGSTRIIPYVKILHLIASAKSLYLPRQVPHSQVLGLGCGPLWGGGGHRSAYHNVANSCEDPLRSGTYFRGGPHRSRGAALGVVTLILCRRTLADKGTKKGMSYGGNRKMSGYSGVWFIPGRTGEVRGHSTQQRFFLRAKRLLGRGWTWREKDIRTGGARGRQTVVLATQSRMLARADKNGKAELRETLQSQD